MSERDPLSWRIVRWLDSQRWFEEAFWLGFALILLLLSLAAIAAVVASALSGGLWATVFVVAGVVVGLGEILVGGFLVVTKYWRERFGLETRDDSEPDR